MTRLDKIQTARVLIAFGGLLLLLLSLASCAPQQCDWVSCMTPEQICKAFDSSGRC